MSTEGEWRMTVPGIIPDTDSLIRRSLIRYIDTYRDPNAEVMEEEEEEEKKKPWWKGGGAAAGKKYSDFVTPTEWLNTDMREGLNAVEVERRRKAAGWNELSAEKENMVSIRDSNYTTSRICCLRS